MAQHKIRIKGVITNRLSDTITASYDSRSVEYHENTYAARIAPDGSFTLNFPIPGQFTEVRLEHGQQATELFVDTTADLTLKLDAADFDSSLTYSGSGSELANFMAQRVIAKGMLSDRYAAVRAEVVKPKDSFLAYFDRLWPSEMQAVKRYADFPNNAVIPYQYYFVFNRYNALLDYPRMHEVMTKHSYDVPPEGYDIVDYVGQDFNDDYMALSTYRQYIGSFYIQKITAERARKPENKGKEIAADTVMLDAIIMDYAMMPPKSAEYAAAYKINMMIPDQPIATSEALLKEYKKHFPKSTNNALMSKTLAEVKKKSKGQPELDFAFTTIDGKPMKLSALKGKVVMIDFWASWCGPCRMEMPHSKVLEEKLRDKPVVFLYVSIDEDEAAWKKGIEQMSIKGMHTRANGWSSKIPKLYNIRGVPSYYLIDKNGKFAVDNVPRPSDGTKLEEAIQALLK
jgi:thiol-disulfide isomerase/thioredoxin